MHSTHFALIGPTGGCRPSADSQGTNGLQRLCAVTDGMTRMRVDNPLSRCVCARRAALINVDAHIALSPPPPSVIAQFGRKARDRRIRARAGFTAVRGLYISCAYPTTHHGSPTPLPYSLRSQCLSSLRVNKPLLLALPNSSIPPHRPHVHADNFGPHTNVFHRIPCPPSCRNERNGHICLTSSRLSLTCTDTFSNDCSGSAG